MTTIGQLITELFATYQQQFHDDRLAAAATQVVVDELLRARERRAARARRGSVRQQAA
jgi:hypothetical protein